jgi:hypothetical protein
MEQYRFGRYGSVFFFLLGILVMILPLALMPPSASAGEMEILLDKLVKKGVLTQGDADEIAKETKQAAAQKEKAEQEKKQEDTKTAGVPDWVKNMKLGGDLRLRYQGEDRENDGSGTRSRGRIRLRLGAEAEPAENWTVGARLATGSGDPRSTNVTMENSFEMKQIRVDQAFARYRPLTWLSFVGGKFENPLFRPSDLLWDSDITPEGAALQLAYPVSKSVNLFFTGGFFLLDESASGKDPFMWALQPGVNWKITNDTNLKVAVAYYDFSNVKDSRLDYSANTNTLVGNRLRYGYSAPVVSAELGFDKLSTFMPYLGFFGEYTKNPDPSKDASAYIAGIKFGDKSVRNFGDWQFQYSYRRIEKDAWLDIFPDSDFYRGATNTLGHEGILTFGLTKNVNLTLDYYNARQVRGSKNTEHLIQADLNLRF